MACQAQPFCRLDFWMLHPAAKTISLLCPAANRLHISGEYQYAAYYMAQKSGLTCWLTGLKASVTCLTDTRAVLIVRQLEPESCAEFSVFGGLRRLLGHLQQCHSHATKLGLFRFVSSIECEYVAHLGRPKTTLQKTGWQ